MNPKSVIHQRGDHLAPDERLRGRAMHQHKRYSLSINAVGDARAIDQRVRINDRLHDPVPPVCLPVHKVSTCLLHDPNEWID